jgi:hypothetical protein
MTAEYAVIEKTGHKHETQELFENWILMGLPVYQVRQDSNKQA